MQRLQRPRGLSSYCVSQAAGPRPPGPPALDGAPHEADAHDVCSVNAELVPSTPGTDEDTGCSGLRSRGRDRTQALGSAEETAGPPGAWGRRGAWGACGSGPQTRRARQ